MLGLVLLYWIGKRFYKLAEEYNKSEWGYAILGVVVYYGGIVFVSFIVGFVGAIVSPGFTDNMNDVLFGLLMIPFGILSCYGLYKYLENNWKKNQPDPNELIDEFGKE
jgi:uncharacterized membrane protein (DUF485 family)